MADHEIYITQLPDLDIQKKDIESKVNSDGELLGYLGISRGTLSWKPKYGRKRRHFDWEKLDEISEDWIKW